MVKSRVDPRLNLRCLLFLCLLFCGVTSQAPYRHYITRGRAIAVTRSPAVCAQNTNGSLLSLRDLRPWSLLHILLLVWHLAWQKREYYIMPPGVPIFPIIPIFFKFLFCSYFQQNVTFFLFFTLYKNSKYLENKATLVQLYFLKSVCIVFTRFLKLFLVLGMTLNCIHIFIRVAFSTDVSWGRPVSVSSYTVVFIY